MPTNWKLVTRCCDIRCHQKLQSLTAHGPPRACDWETPSLSDFNVVVKTTKVQNSPDTFPTEHRASNGRRVQIEVESDTDDDLVYDDYDEDAHSRHRGMFSRIKDKLLDGRHKPRHDRDYSHSREHSQSRERELGTFACVLATGDKS